VSRPVKITAPLQGSAGEQIVESLRAGDSVLLSGVIYTARDAAHQRLFRLLRAGEPAPFELRGAVIYYCGPTPAPPGRPIGSAGPTTSYRMDAFAPLLHAHGVKATIGKGPRGQEVRDSLREHRALYFGATGGAGALLAACVQEARVLAFPDLGPEAIHELKVEDFPLLVINDAQGGDLFGLFELGSRP
jgi:fumarate hydratase subunit beta